MSTSLSRAIAAPQDSRDRHQRPRLSGDLPPPGGTFTVGDGVTHTAGGRVVRGHRRRRRQARALPGRLLRQELRQRDHPDRQRRGDRDPGDRVQAAGAGGARR